MNANNILSPTSENIAFLATRLQEGHLVAFPTETVYGLGAHALNPSAVEKIFRAKNRPTTDPLIVHIGNLQQAWSLVSLSTDERCIFECLASVFWPGPLTLVVPKSPIVPPLVTANGNTVGIRIPNHPLALQLLHKANIPLAAPSANRFGHVSPTTAEHVAKDLAHIQNLYILDGGSTSVGIESTVLRIQGHNLFILRQGKISGFEISRHLSQNQIQHNLHYTKKTYSEVEAQEAPGQLLLHYAPKIPAFVYRESLNIPPSLPSGWGVLDFAQCLSFYRDQALYYQNLSPTGSPEEASQNLYKMLRILEDIPNIKAILLVNLEKNEHPLLQAIAERLHRASAGKTWPY